VEKTIFKPRLELKLPLKFFKFGHWFKLSAGLNLETFDTILSGKNHI